MIYFRKDDETTLVDDGESNSFAVDVVLALVVACTIVISLWSRVLLSAAVAAPPHEVPAVTAAPMAVQGVVSEDETTVASAADG